MTALNAHLHPAGLHQDPMALSPLGYLVSSFGGLATGIGVAFLIWHLI